MIECRNCHQPMEDNNQFCAVCGEKLISDNKLGFVFSLISLGLGAIAFHIVICIIAMLFGICAIGMRFIKPFKKWVNLEILFGILGIIISLIWLLAYIN